MRCGLDEGCPGYIERGLGDKALAILKTIEAEAVFKL
jgi:hypothetical protein